MFNTGTIGKVQIMKIHRLLLVLFLSLPYTLYAASNGSVHHRVSLELFPDTHRLSAVDTITLNGYFGRTIGFMLNRNSRIMGVSADNQPATYDFKNSHLVIKLSGDKNPGTINIQYSSVFNDPVPIHPVNMDNPGFGVSGTISEKGTFLLSGAGWYPEVMTDNITSSFDLSVTAPEGIVAVTSGKSMGQITANGKTISKWRIDHTIEGLTLSAGPFSVSEKKIGSVTAATYFFPENKILSDAYLDATANYIRMYEDLFGSYAFEKFAVVENFFPTGYGFPSYTLLGSRVLRLPFIIHTSLGHEIAHCWWGNGVLVDFQKGNWCEGLTTYVADYHYKEKRSAASAMAYRQQMLQSYSTLVDESHDFPIDQFISRKGPVTKAVGYDKVAMVFHMLKKKVGDEIFLKALRALYSQYLFKQISWNHIQLTFEKQWGRSLDRFFHQWIHTPGALMLSLEHVAAKKMDNGFTISGTIVQKPPFYQADIPISLKTENQAIEKTIPISLAKTDFRIHSPTSPLSLSIDPFFDLFRRLYASEIPATVNSLKGSRQVKIAVSDSLGQKGKKIGALLQRSLGLEGCEYMDPLSISEKDLMENDFLFIGKPETPLVSKAFPPANNNGVAIEDDRFSFKGSYFDDPSDILFYVMKNKFNTDKTLSLFLPLSTENAEKVAGKITHYGKYSYLIFRNGQNIKKGTWQPETSPLMYRWHENNNGKVK